MKFNDLKFIDYITIVIILLFIILFTISPFNNDSLVSKFIRPVKNFFTYTLQDLLDMVDKTERPGYQPESGILVISNFETKDDISQWQTKNSRLRQINKFFSEGTNSCSVTFLAEDKNVSRIYTDNFPKNWSNFEKLKFEIFNPSLQKFRIILQIKDREGKRYKENISLAPESTIHYNRYIQDIGKKVNLDKIISFNLFRWKPKLNREIYFDNLRLVAEGFEEPEKANVYSTTNNEEPAKANFGEIKSTSQSKAKSIIINASNQNNYSLTKWPCTVRISFKKGEVDSTTILTLKDAGKSIPFHIKVSNKWEDYSFREIILDFQTNFEPLEKKKLALFYGEKIFKPNITEAINIKETPNAIIINTGPIKLRVSKEHFAPFTIWRDQNNNGIFLDEELVSMPGDLIIQSNGTVYRSSNDYMSYILQIEEIGPLRILLKAEGQLRSDRGDPLCKFVSYIQAYYGKSFISVYQKFENVEDIELNAISLQLPFAHKFEQLYSPNTGVQMHFPVKLIQVRQEKSVVLGKRNRLSFDRNLSNWLDISSKEIGATLALKSYWDLEKHKKYSIYENKIDIDVIQNFDSPFSFESLLATENLKFKNINTVYNFSRSFDYLIYYHGYDVTNIQPYNIAQAFLNPINISVADE